MGTSIETWKWLKEVSTTHRILFNGASIVDICPQNLLSTSNQEDLKRDILDLIVFFRPELTKDSELLENFATKMAANACIAPGVRATYMGEILVKAGFQYISFDIYDPGVRELNAHILDLNAESTPPNYKGIGDLVLNFGTSEHIFNQINCFKAIHDFTKPGGFIWHQVPSLGYLDHGYFNYNPKFFKLLAESNSYQVIHWEFVHQGNDNSGAFVDNYKAINSIYDRENVVEKKLKQSHIANGIISVLFKKIQDKPFQFGLDISTTGGAVYSTVSDQYSYTKAQERTFEEETSVENSTTVESVSALQSELTSNLDNSNLGNKGIASFWQKLRFKKAINDCIVGGRNLVAKKKWGEAIAHYELAIAFRPNLAEAYLELGNALIQKGDIERAIGNYHKAIALKPNWSAAYFYRGNALQCQEKYEEAVQDYQTAKALKLDWSELHSNLTQAQQGLANPKSIQSSQELAIAHYQQATQLANQRNLEEAIENYRLAISFNPHLVEAYLDLGRALTRQANLEEAVNSYQTAIELNPNLAEAYLELGHIQKQQQKLDSALECYQKAVFLIPSLSDAAIEEFILRQGFVSNLKSLSILEIYKALVLGVEYVSSSNVIGDIAEFGTMSGKTATLLAAALAKTESNPHVSAHLSTIQLHLFDSFQGLPKSEAEADIESPHVQSGTWAEGACRGGNKQQVLEMCKQYILESKILIYEGWYKDTLPTIPPDTKFAMLHVDCDLYQSTWDVLETCFGQKLIQEGAIILFDDWNCNLASPKHGERKAWNDIVNKFSVTFSDCGGYGWAGWKFIVHSYS